VVQLPGRASRYYPRCALGARSATLPAGHQSSMKKPTGRIACVWKRTDGEVHAGVLLLLFMASCSFLFSGCAGYTSAKPQESAASNAVAPTITTQPTNQAVTAGQTATFTVVANGTAPLSYQWQKNGANIAGAASPSYTTPVTTTADSGSTFTVTVSNGTLPNATSSAATLTVNAAPTPNIQVNPASISFGSSVVGTSLSQPVIISNSGTATLTITAVTVTGSGFGVSGFSLPLTVSAGQQATITAAFLPGSSGAVSGSVSITSNAPTSPTTINLTGTGLQAQISANPMSVNFGTVVDQSTNSQPIILTNNGNATLTFSQITVAGTGFAQTGLSTTTTIAAGAHMTFNATFGPTTPGAVTGSIALDTNAAAPLVINLSGTGQAQTFLLGANPTTLAFGSVLNGSTSQLTTLITNNGNATVTISGVTTTGAGFSASGISNGTMLTPAQSATLTVTFAPTQGGAVSGANVSIASNATGSPTIVTLTGTGLHNVALMWGASSTSGVTYNVFRGTSPGGESTTALNSSPISSLTYTDANVTSGQTYYYVVEAVNSAGSSAPSNEASAGVPTP